jgi:alkylation response protein AidB-like acyl-CoA dehydrogenase
MMMHAQTAKPLTGPGGLADQLGPSIKGLARGMDERREMSAALLAELRSLGAFGLLTPAELGGREAPLTTVLQVYEELGRLDASVAWVVWNGNFGFIAALLSEAGVRQIWPGEQPGPVFANGIAEGVAVPSLGGYRVSGEWRMVSGINAANWAIDEVVRLAAVDPEHGGLPLADCRRSQAAIAESEADRQAARLLLYSATGTLQQSNETDTPVTVRERAELRAAMSHAAQVSRRVLTAMYELGGSASLYRGHPLERLFRDGMAAAQHANHSAAAFEAAGRVRLGLPPRMPHF